MGDGYPDIAKVWLGPKLIVLLYDPRDVELVLSSQVYIDKSNEYRFFQPWLGEGLLISTGTGFFVCPKSQPEPLILTDSSLTHRSQVAFASQADRAHLPSERAEELH